MLPSGDTRGNVDRGEPAVTIGLAAACDCEEFVLDALGDWAASAVAHGNAVNGANRGNLRGSAAEENFVRDVKHFARQNLLGDWNVEIAADGHNGVAGDAG